jgi:hypothetical protein
MTDLRQKLTEIGYNRDTEIEEVEWQEEKEEKEHSDRRSLAAIEHKDEPTYRDDNKTKSVELKDYRNRKYEADFVAELEHYNPDKAPIRHILIDFPNWLWKNRIRNRGPKQK